MNLVDYNILKDKIRKNRLLDQNNKFSLFIILFELAFLSLIFIYYINTEVISLNYFLSLILIGISMFRCFSLLHEAGHKALFKQGWANDFAGYVLSPVCVMPYSVWRKLHLMHHKWVGVIDKDPTQKDLLNLNKFKTSKKFLFRVVWWLCLPIPSIQLVLKVFWLAPVLSVIKKEYKDSLSGLLSISVCLIPHLIMFFLLGTESYLYYVVPAILVYFFWFECINFTHHSGIFPYTSQTKSNPIPLNEQDSVSRTSSFSKWISIPLAYNFNFHTEHHYFPRVPWHNLPKVHELVLESKSLADYTDVPFLKFSYELRTSDPVSIYINPIVKLKENNL